MKLDIIYKKTTALAPYAGNPLSHPAEQIEELAKGIRQFGFTNPILIDGKGEIIAGHGRLMAALKLGLKEVPCIELGHLSEAQKRAYRIADNKVSRKSFFDMEAVAKEIQAIAELDVDFDLALTGFDSGELEDLLKETTAMLDSIADGDEEDNEHGEPSPKEATRQTFEEEEEGQEEEEAATFPAPTSRSEPKASGEKHSLFEIIMLHENKVQLVETLHRIKSERAYETMEEALMEMVRNWNNDRC